MESRRLLPLLTNDHFGRSAITCQYRCNNACSHDAPNTSGNEYFGDVVGSIVRRRGLLKAGTVLAAAGAGMTALGGSASAAPADAERHGSHRGDGLNFDPVAPNTEDKIVTADGYDHAVVIRWGDAVLPGAPKFDFDKQTAAAQAKQFGFNNDFCGLVPLGYNRWLMGSNHEYTTESFMFKGYSEANPTEEQVRIGWAAHGFSVVVVQKDFWSGKLVPQLDRHYNRRITVTTQFEFDGPAAGSDFLKTSVDKTGRKVFGTFGNCSGGVTPWGTYLSGEENFDGYFASPTAPTDPRVTRYGKIGTATVRKWERFDKRFDITQEPNEFNRFGWVVEIDPKDPDAAPVKHTALGRFKHEACNVRVARDGRVVAYMGDDERFDYIYKFVSSARIKHGDSPSARAHNKKLLSDGTLYVAKFTGDSPAAEIDGTGKLPSDGEFDGSGQWIPLASGNKSFVDGFTAEQVYVFTRMAADKVGATKMDRPEDIEPSPKSGRVYAALTNNTDRGVAAGKEGPTEINPRVGNKHGHILEWEEKGGDPTATKFSWKLLLVCGDPASRDTYFGGYDKTQVSPISCPDNLAFDKRGNLWIASDGNALKSNDGLFAVPVEGKYRGRVKQFLTVPKGAETCGPVITEDFVLVSVQHPGEITGASADNPLSHWPDGGTSQPRPAVVSIWPRRGSICD
ncbi:PhoX family phosphatase [Actinocrispum sp. NPDC049592]|uniref:PhoX family protein n=1 Tax=Actinocrispum sp. NPDC049592 TaxID=3154835 RepID=UPI003422152F